MPEFCTCGAKLVEDARFCHKCGRPTRDEPLLAEVEAEPPPLPVAVEVPKFPPIGFGNHIAVWIAIRIAVGAFALSLVTGILFILWYLVGGFAGVYLYAKRTGERLSVRNGARLGWLTGVFSFVLCTILVTLFEIQLTQPETAAELLDQLRKVLPEADARKTLEVIRAPMGVFMGLSMMFMLLTLLPALGGWLGARFLQGRRRPAD